MVDGGIETVTGTMWQTIELLAKHTVKSAGGITATCNVQFISIAT